MYQDVRRGFSYCTAALVNSTEWLPSRPRCIREVDIIDWILYIDGLALRGKQYIYIAEYVECGYLWKYNLWVWVIQLYTCVCITGLEIYMNIRLNNFFVRPWIWRRYSTCYPTSSIYIKVNISISLDVACSLPHLFLQVKKPTSVNVSQQKLLLKCSCMFVCAYRHRFLSAKHRRKVREKNKNLIT